MRALRNIAIIAALAFVVAAVPGGGNAATAVLTAITLAFLAAIGWAGYQIYRSQQLTILSLTDGQRGVLIAAVGAIALMIAGADELLDTGAGTLVWIAVLAASIVAIWRLWVQSQTY
jgi:drug/metabolite transporter (DMT)-like permease